MTEQQALIATKEGANDVAAAIGFSKGMFTWENLLSAAIALIICIIAIWIIMKLLRRAAKRLPVDTALADFVFACIRVILIFVLFTMVADKLGLPYGGMNHLNGKQALAFCRLRSIDSNWERTGRQRRTIQAVLTKAKTLSLTDLNDLADSVLSMIDTDLDNETIIGLMMSLGKFAGKTADQLMVPDRDHILPGGMGYNKADFDYEAERIRVFLES